jgi:methanogen homoaconitase large subunit
MGTLAERILGADAGSYVDCRVDHAYAHDGTGVLAHHSWKEMGSFLADPRTISIIFDHIVPANNSTTAELHADLRKFAAEHGIRFSDCGGAICHQFMAEGLVVPGEVVVGADSHTCTLGAFGAFATGVGATDLAAVWSSGETWLRVPETIRICIDGSYSNAAEAKDIALTYVAKLGMDGGSYMALEFVGGAMPHFSMDDRLTLCNLAVETGAKAGLCYADRTTCEYLRGYGRPSGEQCPESADYASETTIDLADVVPVVAIPPRVDTIKPVGECEGIALDQVFVGTCTNGRASDIARFARAVKGRKVAVRTIVVPASRRVYLEALAAGHIADIITAGCMVAPPGCGPCLGVHSGVLGEGEVCLSTANRNFKNRMGIGGEIYLASVGTAAASAIRGEITSPEGAR